MEVKTNCSKRSGFEETHGRPNYALREKIQVRLPSANGTTREEELTLNMESCMILADRTTQNE